MINNILRSKNEVLTINVTDMNGSDIEVKVAKSGSIYVSLNGKTVRISSHKNNSKATNRQRLYANMIFGKEKNGK